nr:SAV_915 family protein [Streptomyces sp. SID5468]
MYVPVRPGRAATALRICRTPQGVRTVVAFTSRHRLADAFGPGQPWIRLGTPALRALAEPLGVHEVTIDPRFSVDADPGVPVG